MNRRLSGKEQSLNAPIGEDGDEWQDWVVDNDMDQELKFAQNEEMEQRKDLLQDSIKILNENLKSLWKIKNPKICVLGLNPHAGEGGFMGSEEIEIIEPAINALLSEKICVEGPISADTAFIKEKTSKYDAYLAMFHDQGLPVLKSMGFGDSVNITLGLPFTRISVDHGTAYELAGKNKADPSSFKRSMELAFEFSS